MNPSDTTARKKWPTLSHFCIRKNARIPFRSIQPFTKNSVLIICAIVASSGLALSIPKVAAAFWPFAVTRAASNPTPLLHDSSLALMDAPLSTDPTVQDTSVLVTTSDGSALVPINNTDIKGADPAVDKLSIPTAGAISEYTVQQGDSLSEIAQKYSVSVNTILWANDITDPKTIKTGTKLVILPVSGIQHTIRAGETLSTIAKKFGADASDIAQYNGLDASGALKAGTTIIIPGGELPATASVSTTKSTSTTKSSTTKTSTKSSSVGTNLSNATSNPYRGGSGAEHDGFFTNPLPGARLTQGIHGWNGVDLGAPTGTPIRAAAAGTVILVRTSGWNGGYGEYVIIDNGQGIQTLYAHMSRTAATVGDTVSAGEVIGYVGTTGDATGPHLHFEVRGARNPFADCKLMSVCSPK